MVNSICVKTESNEDKRVMWRDEIARVNCMARNKVFSDEPK